VNQFIAPAFFATSEMAGADFIKLPDGKHFTTVHRPAYRISTRVCTSISHSERNTRLAAQLNR